MPPSLRLAHSQRLVMTAELQQTFALLQLSGVELVTAIRDALAANPLLDADESTLCAIETGTDSYSDTSADSTDAEWLDSVEDASHADTPPSQGNTASEHSPLDLLKTPETLSSHLEEQVRLLELSDTVRQKTFFLIGELNEDGFLEASLEEIASWAEPDSLSREMGEWNAALSVLHSLDPCGVGARSPQEALLIQIQEAAAQAPGDQAKLYSIAERILTEALPELARRDYSKIRRMLACPEEAVLSACQFIRSLSPRPASNFKTSPTLYVIPDVLVRRSKGQWTALLNPATSPTVRIHEVMRSRLTEDSGRLPKEWRAQLNEAQAFVRGLGQRYKTLLAVASAIVELQQEFFHAGDSRLKPMVMQDIADMTGLHESTVSRAVNGKFLQCSLGVFELRHFFSARISDSEGEAFSSRSVREKIRELIAAEPSGKPYSDAKLALLLSEQGYPVARRTVAKYREQENIPSASLRKKSSSN